MVDPFTRVAAEADERYFGANEKAQRQAEKENGFRG
jgi:hypothetical protein